MITPPAYRQCALRVRTPCDSAALNRTPQRHNHLDPEGNGNAVLAGSGVPPCVDQETLLPDPQYRLPPEFGSLRHAWGSAWIKTALAARFGVVESKTKAAWLKKSGTCPMWNNAWRGSLVAKDSMVRDAQDSVVSSDEDDRPLERRDPAAVRLHAAGPTRRKPPRLAGGCTALPGGIEAMPFRAGLGLPGATGLLVFRKFAGVGAVERHATRHSMKERLVKWMDRDLMHLCNRSATLAAHC